eukprot:scaffold32675_cov61-Phaeocystis_antarctica.AAC.1
MSEVSVRLFSRASFTVHGIAIQPSSPDMKWAYSRKGRRTILVYGETTRRWSACAWWARRRAAC